MSEATAAQGGKPMLTAMIVATAMFMASLDSTIITTALPRMAQSFHISPVNLSLGITVYILVMAAFLPSSNWIADRLGARRVFAAAIVGFVAASVLCGMSHNLWEFVGARALQALAGTMMTPVGNMVLLRSTEKKDLVSVITISTTPALVAPVIGPPIGGFIISALAWPWIFFLNVPIGMLGVVLALRFIPDIRAEKRRPFDTRGFLLNAAALGFLIYGLDRLGAEADWRLPAALAALGALLSVVAVRHALKVPHPLLSLAAMRFLTFRSSSIGGGFLVRMPFRATSFILPLMFQVGFGMSAFQSGVLLIGFNGGDLLLKTVTTRILRWAGFRSALAVSGVLTGLSTGGLALFSRATPFWAIFLGLGLAGMCRSVLITGVVSMTFADVSREEVGHATVLNNVLNQVTGAIAISIAAIVMSMASRVRGAAGLLNAADCRVALLVFSAIGLLAVIAFLRLPRDVADEVSGHRPRRAAARLDMVQAVEAPTPDAPESLVALADEMGAEA